MAPHDAPQVNTRLVREGMDGARRAALLRNVAIATRQALEPVDGVEAEQCAERAPFQHPRIDLPLVAAQLELAWRGGARLHGDGVLPLAELAHRDARRLLLVRQAGVSKQV